MWTKRERNRTRWSRVHVSAPSAVAVLLATLAARVGADPLPPDVFAAPATFSVSVEENRLPGGNVFRDGQVVDTGQAGAPSSVQRLHAIDHSANFSGRSAQIDSGFASAQADQIGNGGVGVTSWLAITPGVSVTSQVVATALWTQTFSNLGSSDTKLSLNLHIPEMEVGLIGVPPNRSGPSDTETATAKVDLAVTINRADGTFEHGGDLSFGMEAIERQNPLGPGVFANFPRVDLFDSGNLLFNPFLTFKDNGDPFVPKFSLDDLSFTQLLGTLHPGDILSYVYTLTVVGTTHGGEQGFLAFIGDPFDLTASGPGLEVTAIAAAVPEPSTWMLSVFGLLLMVAGVRATPASRARPPAAP